MGRRPRDSENLLGPAPWAGQSHSGAGMVASGAHPLFSVITVLCICGESGVFFQSSYVTTSFIYWLFMLLLSRCPASRGQGRRRPHHACLAGFRPTVAKKPKTTFFSSLSLFKYCAWCLQRGRRPPRRLMDCSPPPGPLEPLPHPPPLDLGDFLPFLN